MIRTKLFDPEGSELVVRERAKTAVPMGRPGEVDEVACAAIWLCSDEASCITGTMLDMGGGR